MSPKSSPSVAPLRLPPDDPDLILTTQDVMKVKRCTDRMVHYYVSDPDPKRRLRSFFGGQGSKRLFLASDVRKWILSNVYTPAKRHRSSAGTVRASR